MADLINMFWQYALERGDKPQPVWAVVSQGGQQPKGYVIAWSVNKRAAQQRMDALQYAGIWTLERREWRP